MFCARSSCGQSSGRSDTSCDGKLSGVIVNDGNPGITPDKPKGDFKELGVNTFTGIGTDGRLNGDVCNTEGDAVICSIATSRGTGPGPTLLSFLARVSKTAHTIKTITAAIMPSRPRGENQTGIHCSI